MRLAFCDAVVVSSRRPGERDVARHAFLQQQLRRLYDGFGMKARTHPPVMQGVGDADDGHALVMGHVSVDHGELGAFGQARACIVHGFVPAIGAAHADGGHSRKFRAAAGATIAARPLA